MTLQILSSREAHAPSQSSLSPSSSQQMSWKVPGGWAALLGSGVKNTQPAWCPQLLALCKVCIRYDCSISRLAQFLLCWCYDVWVSVYNQSNHILTQLGSVLSKQADHISHFADFRLHIHWLPITSYFTSHFCRETEWDKQKPNTTFPPLTPSLGRPGQTWLSKKFPLKSGQKDSWLAKLSTNHQYYQSPDSESQSLTLIEYIDWATSLTASPTQLYLMIKTRQCLNSSYWDLSLLTFHNQNLGCFWGDEVKLSPTLGWSWWLGEHWAARQCNLCIYAESSKLSWQ